MIINEATSDGLATALNKRLKAGRSEKEIIDSILSIDRKIFCDEKTGEWKNGLPNLTIFKSNVVKALSKLNSDINAKDFVDRIVSAIVKAKDCTINDMPYNAYHYCQVNGISYEKWMNSKSASVVNESAKVNYFNY